MRGTPWILLICLLIVELNSDFCGASPAASSAPVDYQDDDYDYGEDETNLETQTTKTAEFVAPAYFEQAEISVKARPGDTVILNCDARNFAISNVAIWYKNATIVSSGQSSINTRFEVMKNNSLKLADVTSEDSDDYYCVILPSNVKQHTMLKVGARLSILCDDRDVTDRSQTFKQGDHHKLVCETFLPTEADIKWSLNGKRLLLSAEDAANGVVVLDNVDEADAGVYQCLGDDGSKDPAHGMVTIDVQYSPKVSTHRHHVNCKEGTTAEIYCDYRANPIAMSFFIKDGKTLALSDKYSLKNSLHKEHNRTTLLIKHVDASDLGEYVCHVENVIGANEVRVQLSYAPETPQFESKSIEGNKVTMHWLVRSMQPLSEAMLDYKLTMSYTWSTVSMIKTHHHDKESGIWKITHQMELTPGLWHVKVKTKNTHGWSHFSAEYDLKINDTDDSNQIDEGAVPPEDLVRAGFGPVGGDSRNAACTVSLLPGLIFAALSTFLLRL